SSSARQPLYSKANSPKPTETVSPFNKTKLSPNTVLIKLSGIGHSLDLFRSSSSFQSKQKKMEVRQQK
ncbi:MAG: hypothetical protein ACI959_001242, partial [Limisphaerales bacterium]